MIVLDYRDSRPLYQQVKDSLRRMMLTGLLEPDEKLRRAVGLPRTGGAGGGGVHLLCGGQRELCLRRGRRASAAHR